MFIRRQTSNGNEKGAAVSAEQGVNVYYPEKTNITGHFDQSSQWATPASPGPYKPMRKIQETDALLGEQAEMAGDAQPFSIFEDPRVGETPTVFVVLAFVGSLFVGCANNDDRVAVSVQFHVF